MATLPELLQRQAADQPSRTALQGPDSAFSYAQMMQADAALADQLTRLGVRRAGLCGDDSVAWILGSGVPAGQCGVCTGAGFFLQNTDSASD